MTVYETGLRGYRIREAQREDTPQILQFIRDLADYEGLLQEVKADLEGLEEALFDDEAAQVVLAELEGRPIGFALFFYNFSTFEGRPGLYLEDLYIQPDYRNRGYGKKLLEFLAHKAHNKRCKRFEWWCLDTNTPSYAFYKALGAQDMVDWTVFRIDGDTLVNMSQDFERGQNSAQ
ncbi:MAG: GNAT family N-acetyltransferase [Tissierellia bacterium]|nr:GNAT family N-acetyltransferase [Tissierellia bacterium]